MIKKTIALLIILVIFAKAQKPNFKQIVTAGYQGWFANEKAGRIRKWNHWSAGNSPSPGWRHIYFDLYPDVSEYPEEVLQTTSLGNLGSEVPSKLFASDTD